MPCPSLIDSNGPATNGDSILSVQSYETAQSSIQFSTVATKGHSSINTLPRIHRFTLLRPGTKRGNGSISPTRHADGGWNPLELIFSSGLLVQKCDICLRRIGWKPVLECDDCGLRYVYDLLTFWCVTFDLIHDYHNSSAHVKCGEVAPHDCNIRSATQPPLHASSPLSKTRNNAKKVPSPAQITQ